MGGILRKNYAQCIEVLILKEKVAERLEALNHSRRHL